MQKITQKHLCRTQFSLSERLNLYISFKYVHLRSARLR